MSTSAPAIAIRPLMPGDQQYCWGLNESEVPHVGTETFEALSRLCTISLCRVVVVVDAEPAGFLLGMTRDAPYDSPNFLWFRERYERALYVDRLAVSARHRGRGLGAMLYSHAEMAARAAGLDTLCCEVNLRPPNPVSLQFHQRIGFTQVGEQEAHGKLVAMLARPVAPVR